MGLDLSFKKTAAQVGSIVLVIGLLVGGYYVFRRTAGRQPQPVQHTAIIKPNQTFLYNLTVQDAPARLFGSWKSERLATEVKDYKGAVIKKGPAGLDDTLGEFLIKGPDGVVIYKAERGTSWGNFDIKMPRTGVYTFVLQNTGPLRMTDRSVAIDATFQID